MGGPEAVIAASALQIAAILVTTNPRHFPVAELMVLASDESGQIGPVTRQREP